MSVLASEGFNLVYRNRWFNMGDYLSDFADMGLEAREAGVTLIAGLYYLGSPVDLNYTRAVTWFGEVEPHAPSPCDRAYWREVIEEPAVALARLSLSYPIAGLAFDFELYLAEWFRYGPEEDFRSYSYDALSLRAFAFDEGLALPDIPQNQSYRWLSDKLLLDRFQRWQRKEVYEMARETARSVYAVNPEFSLGVLGFGDCWFHWTILAAWNNPRVPTTIWDESSYGGHDPNTTIRRLQAIREHSLNARYLPGLYTTKQSPAQIVRNMSQALSYCNGFWVYQHDHGQYDLGTEQEYHRAYRRFMALKSVWGLMIGSAAAVLVLAAVALGGVGLRRLMGRGGGAAGPPQARGFPCPGQPGDACGTCRYLQTFGESKLCSKLGMQVKSTRSVGDEPKSKGA